MSGSVKERPIRTIQTPKGPIFDLFAPGAPQICTKKQLQQKISNLDLYDVVIAVLINHHSSADLVSQLETKVCDLEQQVVDLKKDVVVLQEKLAEPLPLPPPQVDPKLEDRVLRQEAYSGRNTIILAGLPEDDAETADSLERNVIQLLQKSDPTLSPQDLGIVHRNGRRRSKPRAVTCVLTRASKKDGLMRKDSRMKFRKEEKVALFHRMSDGLRKRKKELEELPNVEWVAFSGHRLFTLCVMRSSEAERGREREIERDRVRERERERRGVERCEADLMICDRYDMARPSSTN
eukprot:sb/3467551/